MTIDCKNEFERFSLEITAKTTFTYIAMATIDGHWSSTPSVISWTAFLCISRVLKGKKRNNGLIEAVREFTHCSMLNSHIAHIQRTVSKSFCLTVNFYAYVRHFYIQHTCKKSRLYSMCSYLHSQVGFANKAANDTLTGTGGETRRN